MPTALVAGSFGQGDPGSEAILRAFITQLDGWDAVVTSADPASTERRHGCAAVASNELLGMARALYAADAVLFAGGTLFKTLHPSSRRPPNDLLLKGLALAVGGRLLRRPVAMLGVGASHLAGSSKRLAAALARRPHLLVLRDEESGVVLERCGVRAPFRIGADPAWTLFHIRDTGRSLRSGVIVVLSHLAAASLRDQLAVAVGRLAADGITVTFMPWQPGPDERLAHDLSGTTGAEVAPPPVDLSEASRAFRSSTLVVGLRFHALVAAAVAGAPFIAYGHEPKLTAIARRLDQPCVSPTSTPHEVAATICAALSVEPAAADAVTREIEAAKDGFRLLKVLLDRGDADPADVPALDLSPQPRTP